MYTVKELVSNVLICNAKDEHTAKKMANVALESYNQYKDPFILVMYDNLGFEVERISNSLTIRDLDLSVRSVYCLEREGIYFANQILNLTYNRLRAMRNCGKRSAMEILSKCTEVEKYAKEIK